MSLVNLLADYTDKAEKLRDEIIKEINELHESSSPVEHTFKFMYTRVTQGFADIGTNTLHEGISLPHNELAQLINDVRRIGLENAQRVSTAFKLLN